MDLMPSAFGCSSESIRQVRRGGYIYRKLQRVCHWKVTRTTGYVYTATSWTTISAFKIAVAPLRPLPLR
jgi:hypothetical protein